MTEAVGKAWQHFLRLNHAGVDPGITCYVVDAPQVPNQEEAIQDIIKTMHSDDEWECTYANFHSEFENFECMMACSKFRKGREYHLLITQGKLMCGYTTSLGTQNIKHLCTWFGQDADFMQKLPACIGDDYMWHEMCILKMVSHVQVKDFLG